MSKRKILLVDNDRGVREALDCALRHEYQVTLAANGKEALDCLSRLNFDMVLLDLDMPIIDGWDTLEKVKLTHPELPVVVMTGRPHQQLQAIRAGAAGHLEKPLEMESLLGFIRQLVAGKTSPNH